MVERLNAPAAKNIAPWMNKLLTPQTKNGCKKDQALKTSISFSFHDGSQGRNLPIEYPVIKAIQIEQ